LPCDLHLINMRSGFTLSNVNFFLLILHRHGYDCNIAVANPSKLCKPMESHGTVSDEWIVKAISDFRFRI
jgi:hypothetical protein